MKRTTLHILALVALVLASLYARSDAVLLEADVNACLAIADSIPGLKTLTTNAWTTTNIQNCVARHLTCGTTSGITRVTRLNINSPLTGTFPEAMGLLTELNYVQLDLTITGTLPSSWSALSKLATLNIIGSGKISGSYPTSWSSLTALSLMQLYYDTTMAPIAFPSSLSSIGNVVIVGASLSEFPSFLASTGTLATITLQNVKIAGSIPSTFYQNTQLTSFILLARESSDFDDGSSLGGLAGMTKLITFKLSGVGIVGLPTSYPATLRTFTLASMPNLVGTIPQSLMDAAGITSISFNDLPGLTGNLPGPQTPAASKLNDVVVLDTVGLTGTIAPNLFNTPTINLLSITSTSLTGGLPEVTNPATSSLVQIASSSNPQLGGTVPSSYALLRTIFYLYLESSGLTGTIPQTYAQNVTSQAFSTFSLAGNSLSGTMPSINMTSKTSSVAIDFSGCGLTGTIPAMFANKIWGSIKLPGNSFDMCANAGTSDQSVTTTAFQNAAVCQIAASSSTPRTDCACPGTWPTRCFSSTCPPMAPTPMTPPVATPVAEPTSTPTATPVTGVPTETPSALPASQPTSIPLPPDVTPSIGPISIPAILPSLEPTGSASSTCFGLGVFAAATLAVICAL